MKIAKVQFSSWDKIYDFICDIDCQIGDWLIVETELGKELGKLVALEEFKDKNKETNLEKVISLASEKEINKVNDKARKSETLKVCKELVLKHNLEMKLVDVRFSLEANRINFAFISDGRVDFRDLVKDLGSHFGANIRLTQIGSRDEARIDGDCGSCGRELCCKGFIRDFSSITSEMAEAQQVVHRGSDRISGACGRLMCCLSYEYEGYKELANKLPKMGEIIKVEGKKGKVIGHHVLKQTVDLLVNGGKNGDGEVVIEVPIK